MHSRGASAVGLLLFLLVIVAQGKRRTRGERLRCDFEEDMCRIKQDKTDDGRWIRWNGIGTVPSRLEPPSNYWLSNNDTGFYMYAYSSGISRLLSPRYSSVGTGGPKCLTFWYNIFGNRRSGTLSIYQSLNDTYFGQSIWEVTGDMGNVWRPIEIDLTSDHAFRVVFEADMQNDISISIDNVLISDNECPGGMYSLDPKITCDFENEELCGYVQDLSDDIDWKRYSAQDGASGDGPDEDHTFGEDYGFYLCMDQHRTPKFPGHRAHVISPFFNTTTDSDDHCIKFWYYLSGYEVGEINAYMYYEDRTELMFTVDDDQSDIWHRAYFQVPSNVESFKIGFESVRGQGDGIHCIDDVAVFVGTCEMLLTTPAPTTAGLVMDNANCDFETDCRYMPEEVDGKWTTSLGSHYYRQLPSADHTLGTTGGHYMHTSNYGTNEIINLRTPMMYQRNHTKCLQFYFTLYDQYSGSHLNVFIDDSAYAGMPTDPAWTKYSSSEYNKWTLAEIDIQPTEGDFSVVFQAGSGTIYGTDGVDVAIDDVLFLDQECSSVTIAPWYSTIDCDFESEEFCDYQHSQWIRMNGSTPSKDTGPHNDHTLDTAQGHYVYMESSPPHRPGSMGRLVTPPINRFNGPMCLQFWYNMNGDDTGSLKVYREYPTSSTLWHLAQNQGPDWKLAKVDVNVLRSYNGVNTYVDQVFHVAFEASLGNGHRGDIAIDDIKLLQQDCTSAVEPQPRKSIDCDIEAGIDECGFTRDPRYSGWWTYFDYKSTDELERSAMFPQRLTSEYNSFVYCDRFPYNYRIPLKTPPVIPAPQHCLIFSYIIKGAYLSVSIEKASENIDIIVLKKELSPLWRNIQIPLFVNTSDSFKVVFTAIYSSYNNFVALDDIKLMPGKCPDTIPVEKLACDFEKDCRFLADSTEDYAWQISNKETYYNRQLPSYDHTFGTPSGHYYFTSTGRNYRYNGQDRRLLRTPTVRHTGSKRCLQFYYYIAYKPHMLNVYVEDAGRLPVDPIWRTYGRPGATKWVKASVDILPTEGDFSVVFEPITNDDLEYESAIAIDDVIILKQKCSKVIEHEWKSTVDCDFEKDICGYSLPHDGRGDFQWQRNIGMTKTRETGPSTDHTFELSDAKQGNYMYIETSPPRRPGDVAILASPLVPPTNTSVCLEFWYSMFGEDIGTLEVYRSQPAIRYDYVRLWRKEGQRSKRWMKAEVPLNTNYKDENSDFIEHTSTIHFKGTVSYGYKGDIAIDDIKLILKSCEPPPKEKDPLPVNYTICNFENGADECGFEDVAEEGSGAEWNYFNVSSIKFDPTIESDDPRMNMSKGQRSFIFADASELRAGEHVVIMTPSVSSNTDYCLMFSYVTMGDFIINIYSREVSGEEEFIDQLDEDVSSWITKAVHIPPHTNPFKVVFEGVIGRIDEGFLALDDIHVQDGNCSTEAPAITDSIEGVVDDLKDKPSEEDKSQSTISTVVIALLTIALLIAFAFVIFLAIVIKGYRKNASSSSSNSIDAKVSELKSFNSENP